MTTITLLSAAEAATHNAALGDLLQACVSEGASVGFTDASDREAIQHFWQAKLADISAETALLLVAIHQQQIIATLILGFSVMPNGHHRAEISKLLVHPRYRRQGIARQLMQQAEALAQRHGKTLLVLDTRSGDAASTLYLSLGWQRVGEIPAYACSTAGVLDATTIMYKQL